MRFINVELYHLQLYQTGEQVPKQGSQTHGAKYYLVPLRRTMGGRSEKPLSSKPCYCGDTVGVSPSTILIWNPSLAIP